jgi:hypothetical protein
VLLLEVIPHAGAGTISARDSCSTLLGIVAVVAVVAGRKYLEHAASMGRPTFRVKNRCVARRMPKRAALLPALAALDLRRVLILVHGVLTTRIR